MSNGITFPGKPVSVTPTKRYMRYGLQSVNVSGAENESASQVSRPIPTRAHATEASCCTAAPYMLACSLEAMDEFLKRSKPDCAGHLSFYWGRTSAEYKADTNKTVAAALVGAWLEYFQKQAGALKQP